MRELAQMLSASGRPSFDRHRYELMLRRNPGAAINLRGDFLDRQVAPTIWPAFSGDQWETEIEIASPLDVPFQREYRVSRGPDYSSNRTSSSQPVEFQFSK